MVLGPQRGLHADYFSGDQPGGIPVISTIDQRITTEQVLTRWYGGPPSAFHVRWFGYLSVVSAGRHRFSLTSDDGAVLTVDGRRLIDNGGRHEATTATADVELERGPHAVLLEYTQEGGALAIEWQWARDAGTFATVPAWALSPSRSGTARVLSARAVELAGKSLLAVALLLAIAIAWRDRAAVARHPRLAALAFFIVMAAVHTWPLVVDPAHQTRHDNRDTMLNEWIVSWIAHQAPRDPLHLFDGNIFYPDRRTIAYSEPLIPQGVMAIPLFWAGASPPLAYNILLLAGLSLSGWSMCLVIRAWTGSWTAGLVSGGIFAFNAHVLTRIPHMQAQHVEFLPLALLALDRLLSNPRARHAVSVALWSAIQGLASIHLLVFTVFGLTAAILARPEDWWGRRFLPAAKALAIVAAIAAIVLLPFLLPYYHVSREQGLTRSLNDAALYAGTWKDYLSTPSRLHYPLWSYRFFVGTALFPGALGLLLTAVAMVRGHAFRDPRARMCLALGGVGVLLSLGPTLPGYATLFQFMPLLQAIRGTARFGYLATVAVAAVAGFGVVALRNMLSGRAWPAIAILLVSAASLESLAAPLSFSHFYGIAPIYARVPRGPGIHVAEFPFWGPRSAQFHASYMLNSTSNFQPIVNGYSGFQPPSYFQHVEVLQTFPSDAATAMLRTLGVTHVFVHDDQMSAEALEALKARPELTPVETFGAISLYAFH